MFQPALVLILVGLAAVVLLLVALGFLYSVIGSTDSVAAKVACVVGMLVALAVLSFVIFYAWAVSVSN